MSKELKIGLALGSGGARGMCHLGVLEVFEREGFHPDVITGCSMGAISAAVYAAGIPVERMIDISINMRNYDIADIGNVFTSMGINKGNRSLNIIKKLIGDAVFADCKIPLAVTATDLVKGELVTFKSGPIWRAVRSSYAIPAVFQPVIIGNRILVDGGLLERIPINQCRALGADVVVAVDAIGPIKKDTTVGTILTVIERSYMLFDDAVNRQKIEDEADLIITPDVGARSILNFNNNEPTIEVGRRAAMDALPKIYELIERHKKNA